MLCIFVTNIAQADTPIKLEVRVFGKDVIFVFYRGKNHIIDLKSSGNTVKANINIPVEFKLVNQATFKKYASGLKLTNNNQTIVFYTDKELKYQSIINGEKLDAIKFRSQKKKKEDLSTIGKAKNDPGVIKYHKKNDDHILEFNLGNNKSKIASFIRGKYLWVVLDQNKVLNFKENEIFSQFKIIPSDHGTAVRFRLLDGYNNIKTIKTKTGWHISVTDKDTKWDNDNIIAPESLSDNDGLVLKGDFDGYNIIELVDPEVGDTLNIIPVRTTGLRVNSPKDAIEFRLLKSIQGIAISLMSDDIIIEKYKQELRILPDSTLPIEQAAKVDLFQHEIENYQDLATILPVLDKNLDILDFNQQKSRLISEAAMAKNPEEAFKRNLALAKFYYMYEWYHESLDALLVAKKLAPEIYKRSLKARFLTAVNYSLIGEYGNAKIEYDRLLIHGKVNNIDEVILWSKYNNFSLGANVGGGIGFLKNLGRTISLYSEDKYWQLAFAEIEIALAANKLSDVDRLFKMLKKPIKEKYANSLKFYQANYYRKNNRINVAKQLFQSLIVLEDDPFNSTRARFEVTKMLLKHKKITLQKAIGELDNLRFAWRGDQLEYEILMTLANYYRNNNEIMNSLRTYKYIQNAFGNKVSNFYITSEMARIFNDVFLPGGIGETMDDFTVVALFYEFKELNPIGEKGDKVILSIAKKLVQLDLLENATNLLRH
ncbi:MAG: hypothetical protein HRU35_06960, partial [Rickettsiaceae bacterium]|nr:hypothetical protein [Rickettsiaceae bacterium]